MVIDVFHDLACPWCRIGKRNLDAALARWDGPPPEVRWHPFLLDPTLPPEGRPFRPYMAERKGDALLDPMFESVRRAGEAVGLTFRLDRVERAPNTLRAHRLLALAPAEHQSALLDALHRAYFEDGRDLGDLPTLEALATDTGLDGPALAALLQTGAANAETLAEAAWAQRAGVTGVPLFVLDGRLALPGAQPPETVLDALRQVAEPQPTAV